MELKIGDNKCAFYQWDTGQQLILEGAEGCTEVHFCRSGEETALVCPIREEGGKPIADVPNILLQEAGEIHAYLFRRMEDGSETICWKNFAVQPRPKPESYAYTETEVLDYGYLDRRLEALEGEGLGKALEAYLKDNPVQAGATEEEAEQIRQNKENIDKLEKEKLSASGGRLTGALTLEGNLILPTNGSAGIRDNTDMPVFRYENKDGEHCLRVGHEDARITLYSSQRPTYNGIEIALKKEIPDAYSKTQIDAIMGSYITEIDDLLGGED